MPASRVRARCTVARATRSPNDSRRTWSSHDVSLYACRSTCEWASMRPGMSVRPGRSMTSASAGAATCDAGPTASIRSPRTSTTTPSRSPGPTPSKTRAGRRRMARGGGVVARCAVACGANPGMPRSSDRINVRMASGTAGSNYFGFITHSAGNFRDAAGNDERHHRGTGRIESLHRAFRKNEELSGEVVRLRDIHRHHLLEAEPRQVLLRHESKDMGIAPGHQLHEHWFIEPSLLTDERLHQVARGPVHQVHERQPVEDPIEKGDGAARQKIRTQQSDQRDQNQCRDETGAWNRKAQPAVDPAKEEDADVSGYRERGEKNEAPEEEGRDSPGHQVAFAKTIVSTSSGNPSLFQALIPPVRLVTSLNPAAVRRLAPIAERLPLSHTSTTGCARGRSDICDTSLPSGICTEPAM